MSCALHFLHLYILASDVLCCCCCCCCCCCSCWQTVLLLLVILRGTVLLLLENWWIVVIDGATARGGKRQASPLLGWLSLVWTIESNRRGPTARRTTEVLFSCCLVIWIIFTAYSALLYFTTDFHCSRQCNYSDSVDNNCCRRIWIVSQPEGKVLFYFGFFILRAMQIF